MGSAALRGEGRAECGGVTTLENGADITMKDADREAALHWAARSGHAGAVQLNSADYRIEVVYKSVVILV